MFIRKYSIIFLGQGTEGCVPNWGRSHSSASMGRPKPGYWRGGTVWWSKLRSKRNNVDSIVATEHWTNFLPSPGYYMVHGSLPNQYACVLRAWKRHMTVSLMGSCGGCFRSVGYGVCCYGPLCPCITGVRVWLPSRLVPAGCWTPPELPFVADSVHKSYEQ